MQVPLASTPDVVKGNFLKDESKKKYSQGVVWDQSGDAIGLETVGSMILSLQIVHVKKCPQDCSLASGVF